MASAGVGVPVMAVGSFCSTVFTLRPKRGAVPELAVVRSARNVL